MGKLSPEEIIKIGRNATLEKVEEIVKNSIGFEVYVDEVKAGKTETNKNLQIVYMLNALTNQDALMTVQTVATHMLFAMLDTKFRNEILGGK